MPLQQVSSEPALLNSRQPAAQGSERQKPPASSSAKAHILQAMLHRSQIALGQRVKSHLEPDEGATFEQFQDEFSQVSHTDAENLSRHAKLFIEQNKTNPELLVATMNYFNSLSMVMRGTELKLNSDLAGSPDRLTQGVTALYKRSGSAENLSRNLRRISVSPVFTAHPTNLSRPEATALLNQIEHDLDRNLDAFYAALHGEQGPRENKPSVTQEAAHHCTAIAHLHKSTHRVQKALNQTLTALGAGPLEKPLVSIGNWVGGDRDGNPNVTSEVLKQVACEHADVALHAYARKLAPEKIRLIGQQDKQPNLRTLLVLAGASGTAQKIFEGINTTRSNLRSDLPLGSNGSYANPNSLIQDLNTLDLSKLPERDRTIAQTKLNNLVMDVVTSGFHGATTDVRQNSAVNAQTVHALLQHAGHCADYSALAEPEKQALLKVLITTHHIPIDFDAARGNPELKQELQLIDSYREIHDTLGKEALGNCITANTETVSDLLEVIFLLKSAGLSNGNQLDMNVVGLIETVQDLENASEILGGLLSFDWYRQGLQAQDKPQMVMVGYSDSNRLDGSVSSNWAVYHGTQEMMKTAEKYGIELQFFHGRGGTEGRGAGKNYRDEINVHDGASLARGFRQTEQGEEVHDKFGSLELASSNLSDMVSTTLQKASEGADPHYPHYAGVMTAIAEVGRAKYRSLYNNPDIPEFFQASTPIDFVGRSNAGSRPASRKTEPGEKLDLEKLRAIPWVACWSQCRANVPAFFGTGSALKAFSDPGTLTENSDPLKQLQDMYQNWPFFTNLIDRTEMALAKADMDIFSQYVPKALKQSAVFNEIKTEYQETVTQINRIKIQTKLLETRPDEKAILDVKNRVTNATNALQAELLCRSREDGVHVADQLTAPIVVSMQAVANGLGRFG